VATDRVYTTSTSLNFSPDFTTAQRRFRAAVAARQGRLDVLKLAARGPRGEELTIDCAGRVRLWKTKWGLKVVWVPGQLFIELSSLIGLEEGFYLSVAILHDLSGKPIPGKERDASEIVFFSPENTAEPRRHGQDDRVRDKIGREDPSHFVKADARSASLRDRY
jgi:hypothetical protein